MRELYGRLPDTWRCADPERRRPGDPATRWPLIGNVIEDLPDEGAVCVYHSQASYQMPKERRALLSDRLAEAGQVRPLWRVGFEWLDGGARGRESGDHSLGLARYSRGNRSYEHLGFCDPHGRWIEWGPTAPDYMDRL